MGRFILVSKGLILQLSTHTIIFPETFTLPCTQKDTGGGRCWKGSTLNGLKGDVHTYGFQGGRGATATWEYVILRGLQAAQGLHPVLSHFLSYQTFFPNTFHPHRAFCSQGKQSKGSCSCCLYAWNTLCWSFSFSLCRFQFKRYIVTEPTLCAFLSTPSSRLYVWSIIVLLCSKHLLFSEVISLFLYGQIFFTEYKSCEKKHLCPFHCCMISAKTAAWWIDDTQQILAEDPYKGVE